MKVKDLVKELKRFNSEADIEFIIECFTEKINKIGYVDTLYPSLQIEYRVRDTGQEYSPKNTPVVFLNFNTHAREASSEDIAHEVAKLIKSKYFLRKK